MKDRFDRYIKFLIQFYEQYIKSNRQKLLSFGFFLLISISFWFLNVLNNEFNTYIKYPVKFINLPEDKLLYNELPKRLTLKVRAHGFHLLGYQLTISAQPLIVDMEDISPVQIGSGFKYQLDTKLLVGSFSDQISAEIQLEEIEPAKIIFDYTPVVKKKIPVLVNLDYESSNQFLVRQIQTNPDSVICRGPKELMDTLKSIYTENLKYGKLEEILERDVDLIIPEGVICKKDEVNLFVNVEEFTEASIKVPIEVVDLPDSLSIEIYPKEIQVNYRVAISDFDKVKPFQFKMIASYKLQNDWSVESNTNRLKLQLKKSPSFIYTPKFNPIYIDYILKKND